MRIALAALALAALALVCVAAAPAVAQGPGQRGALVRLPYADEGTLTPYSFTSAYGLMTLVYDTLLWRDEDGVPRPWLARSVRASPDGRRLTVRLARNARWHDGAALTAADVAFTFDLLRSSPHPRFTPQLRELEGVTVLAPDRLVIRLRRPSPGFLDQPLADVPIMPRHIWSRLAGRLAPRGLPVGSGPYRLVRHGARGYRFVANDRHFLGRPAVRVVETLPITSGRAVSRAFDRGRIDVALRRSVIGAAALLDAQGVAFTSGPGYRATTLTFNVRRAPFASARLRRAVAWALDLARVARAAAGPGDPIETAERGMLHPRSRWAAREDLHERDVAAARSVLATLRGRPLRVLAPAGEDPARAAGREVVASLRRAGARARLVERSPAALAAAVGQDRPGEDFELAIWPSPPLASHDPDFLRAVFGRGATVNYSGYRSARFERLADRVTTARSTRARRAAVAAELRLLARDLPVLPLYFDVLVFTYRRTAWDGWRFVAGEGIIDKRSFMSARTAGAAPARAPAGAGAGSARIGPLGIVALLLAGLALALVVVGSIRGRRRSP